MLQTHRRLFHRGIQLCDILLIGGAVYGSAFPFARLRDVLPMAFAEAVDPWAVFLQGLVIAVSWVILAARLGFYQSRRTQGLGTEFRALVETWLLSLAAGSLVAMMAWGQLAFQPASTFVLALAGIFVLRLLVRLVLRFSRARGLNFRQVLLVGRGRSATAITRQFAGNPHYGIRVMGSICLPGEPERAPAGTVDLGDLENLPKQIARLGINSVVLCPSVQVAEGQVQKALDLCDEAGIQCYYAPDFLSLKHLESATTWFGDMPAFTFQSRFGTPFSLAVKRAIDVVGASLGLILCLPIFAVAAIVIKLTDRGPVFFRQVRLGRGGSRFYCFKFRSMCVDAETQKANLAEQNEQDGPVFKIRKDPRLTRIGGFLRRYSLDELPQLLNVLKGDMSLVGPRPPVPSEVERYEWWQRRRISIRPGLTCVWQVWGRNKVSFQRWVEMDLFYIDNWSLWMDLKLMLHTVRAVVRGTGA